MAIIDDYLSVARSARSLLASKEVADHWEGPSVLAEWTVAGLAGHLARSVFLLRGILEAPVDQTAPRVTAVGYFVSALSDADLHVESVVSAAIRLRGVESAGPSHDDLLRRYEAVLVDLENALPGMDPELVVSSNGMNLSLGQYLVTRLVEMAVHADDLAVSVATSPAAFDGPVQDAVAETLAAIAVRRHGFTAVLHGLARAERSTAAISAFSAP
jgi:hypothetical protein